MECKNRLLSSLSAEPMMVSKRLATLRVLDPNAILTFLCLYFIRLLPLFFLVSFYGRRVQYQEENDVPVNCQKYGCTLWMIPTLGYCSSAKKALALHIPRRLICQLTKKPKKSNNINNDTAKLVWFLCLLACQPSWNI